MRNWKCRYCGCGDGALGCPWPVWHLVKCFVCLRVEPYEKCFSRNVKVEVVNPHLMVVHFIPKDMAVLIQGIAT